MKNKLLLIGGGGHCKSIIDVLSETSLFDEIGIVDKTYGIVDSVDGIKIVGNDDMLPDLSVEYGYAFISVGSTGNPGLRIKLFEMIQALGFAIPSIISRTASVSRTALIEEGVFIGKRAVVNTSAVIQKCAIINTGAIIEHECQIGEFAHIAPGSVLSGNVVVGDRTHIGTNATIINNCEIGSDSVVGAGSVVVGNISKSVVAYGNPCKSIRKNDTGREK